MVWQKRATSSRTPFLIGTASVERSLTGNLKGTGAKIPIKTNVMKLNWL